MAKSRTTLLDSIQSCNVLGDVLRLLSPMTQLAECIFTERNKQRGDKFLTHVQHLELFGIDVDLLVGGGRGNVLFAAKCVSQKDPKKGKNDLSRELLINGKVASKVIRFLGSIGISEKYIVVSKKKGINDGR